MNKISVTIVDDHKLFREGLKLILNEFSFVDQIYEASSGKDFLQLIHNHVQSDIIFMDIEMPELNGIEATQRAMELNPDLKIIALSMYGDEDYYTRILDAGAKGFILKNSGIHDVEAAIENVLNGKNYFSQEILLGILNSMNKKKSALPVSDLSEREQEVLYQICQGLSNQEIADILHISKRTVDKHRENILVKTNARNTADLVMFAIKNGLVDV